MRKLASKQLVQLGSAVLAAAAFLFIAHSKLQLDSSTAIVCFSVGAIAVAYVTFRLYPFQERGLLKCRPPVPVTEIFATHYSGSNIPWNSFERYWKQVASILGEPAEMLRPSDRFDNELRPRTPLDESNDDLVRFVVKELGTSIRTDIDRTETLDSLIRLLCLRKPKEPEEGGR